MRPRIREIKSVKLVEVLRVVLIHEEGKHDTDPIRLKCQYWHKDGSLLAEKDFANEPND